MKKMSVVAMLLILIVAFSSTAYAGYLVINATVVSVSNSSNNQEAFSVLVTGASGGSCTVANTHITFYPENAGSDAIYNRAYKQVMTALVTGKKVHIYNYSDDSCSGASYVQLIN